MARYKEFENAFSPLHASPDTLMEVQKKMQNEKKTRRPVAKGLAAVLAAVLTLSVAFGAAKLLSAKLSPTEGAKGDVVAAFGAGNISTQKAVVLDNANEPIDIPDMVRENTDAQTVQRLVGDYLYDVEGTLTAGGYTLKLSSFLMDEQGMGIVTCTLENPDGVSYEECGYGEVDLPVSISLWQSPGRNGYMDANIYLNRTESTDKCLQLAVYFGTFRTYEKGSPIYMELSESGKDSTCGQMEICPKAYLPTAVFSAEGHSLRVSALGITVDNPVPVEFTEDELIIRYADGSDYAVTSKARNQSNRLVCYLQSEGETYTANCSVFNRLVDIEAIASVSMEGHYYASMTDDTRSTAALEYTR